MREDRPDRTNNLGSDDKRMRATQTATIPMPPSPAGVAMAQIVSSSPHA